MKRLVVERNHLERKLQGKEDELVKLDGRLQQIQKDKTMLEATIATLRKELVHLRKSNDLLTHVSLSESMSMVAELLLQKFKTCKF